MKLSPSVKHFLGSIGKNEKGEAGVFKKQTLFPFAYDFKNSDKLAFFFPGAFMRKKGMPKFQRSKYFPDLEYNCISFFDPTHFLTSNPNFTLGWFQGTKKIFYCDLVGDLVKEIVDELGIEYQNVLLFGTSGGGLPAIHTASKLNGCKVFCGNIQTDISKYHKSAFKRLVRNIYNGLSEDEVKTKYNDRLSLFDIDINFDLFYAQNLHDKFHYENHFLPFCQKFGFKSENITSLIYSCAETGHKPLSGDIEKQVVRRLLEEEDVVDLYRQFGLCNDMFSN
ncbi:hypothetical protein [Carnimonas bestiolae]|uniref:hypothetical protein n=1 Tax=Carnimonas bestiolae TaxID=3402172 RepID=UPI003EDBB9D6